MRWDEIKCKTNDDVWNDVVPNVIYNRFDLMNVKGEKTVIEILKRGG